MLGNKSKKNNDNKPEEKEKPKKKKRIISSDEEEVKVLTPVKKQKVWKLSSFIYNKKNPFLK